MSTDHKPSSIVHIIREMAEEEIAPDRAKLFAMLAKEVDTREAELSSLRESLKMCVEALESIKAELGVRSVLWPIDQRITKHCDTAISHVKASHPNL